MSHPANDIYYETIKELETPADQLLICDRCGETASLKGDDAVAYCNECGVIEGIYHVEVPCVICGEYMPYDALAPNACDTCLADIPF